MKKALLILTALLAIACIVALPFLCTHSDILPEVSTAYYDYKAKEEALTATGPEAELMRMLTGLSADTKLEPVRTPMAFSRFGLILAGGVVMALTGLRYASGKQPELRLSLMWTTVLSVPFGLIGARLVYALVNVTFYLNTISSPAAMLKSWEGGLSLSGALAFAALAGVIGARLGKASIGRVLDAIAMPLLLLAIYADMAAGSINMVFGPEVSGIGSLLSIDINGAERLDTSVVILSALLVVLFAVYMSLRGKITPSGFRFALTAFLYGSVMILMESLREDGHMVWGFVHAEMAFDLCFALPALLYLAKTKKRILLALLATAVLAGAVVALEFALDRSSIGDGLLYAAYGAVLGGYIFFGCTCAKKRLAV